MKHLEEENKNLISLRTSLLTILTLLIGGMFWLATLDFPIIVKAIFIFGGIYIVFLFLNNVMSINSKINKNIGDIKNERQ